MNKSINKKLYINFAIVFTISFIYSFLRYIFYGNVSLDDIPTLILNKAISLTIVFLLVLRTLEKGRNRVLLLEKYSALVKQLAIVHIILSLVLLGQNYFPKMLLEGKLTLSSNISLLSGVVLFSYLVNKVVKPKNWIVYIFIASHVFFLGYKGWSTPENWHGSLPPLTLITFAVMVFLIFINILNKKN